MQDGSSPTGTRPLPRAVVFDLDGTLVDSYAASGESLNHARAAYALPPLDLDTVRRSVGHGLEQLISQWVGPELIAEGVRLFRARYAEVFAGRTVALPGAETALERLHTRGFPIAVASNKPERFSTPILRSLDLLRFVTCVAGPDTVGSTKPEPAMLRACLARLGVTAADALYVGDMPLDVESARRAGVAVALVATGSSGRDELIATGEPTFGSLEELVGWLDTGR